MNFKCSRGRVNLYREKPRPRWQRWSVYGIGAVIVMSIAWWTLRDTTPVQFIEPSAEDFDAPPGEIATRTQLEDVYWRVSIRHAADQLAKVCQSNKYSVLTHKNILMDGHRMSESFIYLCKPVDKNIVSVLNARRVLSGAATKTVQCLETYGNTTKTITRQYPFSLKYIDGQTFTQRTRVVRDPVESCTWLHAMDIVESVWN